MRSDTLETAWVLMMYMIGLLPFGLAKIFSLWHFANHNQKAVAKMTAISLVLNILLSLALIVPMKAAGLALASSLSGFVLFWLNYRLYKRESKQSIFWNRKLIWLVLSIIAFTIMISIIKLALDSMGLLQR